MRASPHQMDTYANACVIAAGLFAVLVSFAMEGVEAPPPSHPIQQIKVET